MELTVLGCGDAFASDGRFNTSFLLSHEGRHILIDCGASTLIRLKQIEMSVEEIETIVITHFHGDHFGGLPFLILSKQFETDRESPLRIVGPVGIESKVRNLQDALYPETSKYINELAIEFYEYSDSHPLSIDKIRISAKIVTHSPPSCPHGLRIEWGGSVFAFSGDTEWNDALIELAEGTDLFVIECNNLDNETPGHMSYHTIIEKEHLLKAKTIYLTHMGLDVIDDEDISIRKLADGMILNF